MTRSADKITPRLGIALVVEDNAIIALDMEDILHGMGADRVVVCRSCNEALEALAVNDVSFGVLDVDLGDETSHDVAEALKAARKPYLFVTGSSGAPGMVVEMNGAPHVAKPFTATQLAAAVERLLSERKPDAV